MQKGNRISGKKNSGFSMVELIVTVAILQLFLWERFSLPAHRMDGNCVMLRKDWIRHWIKLWFSL